MKMLSFDAVSEAKEINSARAANVDKAEKWLEYVSNKYFKQIKNTINRQTVFDDQNVEFRTDVKTDVEFINQDTVSALFTLKDSLKVCILNFASFKHPGGGFLTGAMAQEEALCHVSTLYPCISSEVSYYEYNMSHLNEGLYMNRAIYSPDVVFDVNGEVRYADVITCASPNNYRRTRVSKEIMQDIVRDRVKFMYGVVSDYKIDVLIVGAWGCGVFRQDPAVVCKALRDNAKYSGAKFVIMAVPDNNFRNFKIFSEVVAKL